MLQPVAELRLYYGQCYERGLHVQAQKETECLSKVHPLYLPL